MSDAGEQAPRPQAAPARAARASGRGSEQGTAIRVLLADDHPVVRAGLAGMLDAEDGIEVVAEAASGDEAVTRARHTRPDVVLMDLRMPGGDGASATARITAEVPGTCVVVLTTYESDSDIVPAVEAGARGYLLKDTTRADLVEAIRAAARGETVLAPSVAAHLMNRVAAPQESKPDALTPREVEVLRLVARGHTNAGIGRELFIGEATVKTHLLRIFAKLDVSDRTAAVTVAIEQGMLPARRS